MKYWFEKNYKTLIIAAFLVPIMTVAIVSISHVTKWYGLSNPVSWAAYLSVGIEIAALSALAAISANMGKKVYFPFAIVTIVQFIGNIYFAYSYIDITTKEFKDWVGLVSPLVEFMGVDPTDFAGHKRFLAFFAGGMLPLISLSFLHMLVKFTEEDKAIEDAKHKDDEVPVQRQRIDEKDIVGEEPIQPIDAKDIISEVSRVRLSEDDLRILQETLLNPPQPNEGLTEMDREFLKKPIPQDAQELILTSDDEIDSPMPDADEEYDWDLTPTNNLHDEPETIENIEEFSQDNDIPILDEFIPEEIIETDVEKTQLEKLEEYFTPQPEVTPEELEQYQNEQDIEEIIEKPIFGDNFDLLQTEPLVQKVNIEEVQAPVENMVIEDDFNYQDTTNDIWKQYNIEQIEDGDDELKKKI